MKTRIRVLARVPENTVETKVVIEGRCKDSSPFSASDPDIDWYKENIPCMNSCPASTRIPEYLEAVSTQNYDLCYKINREDNLFPHTLGRVCAHPCETYCRHGFSGMGDPVNICWSKRTGADYKTKNGKLKKCLPQTDKKVAVVGAGPCGLTVANDLALVGHSVTVFEALPSPGGMMVAGIPVFRLPRNLLEGEINDILDLGVELKLNQKIGEDISLAQLQDDFDAVALTTGCMTPISLAIPGEKLDGVIPGLDFMMQVNIGDRKKIDGTVVVVGGGFTAMDCSRTALRLGAEKVIVIYRRTKNELLVDDRELREASFEGVEFYFLVSPLEIHSSDGKKLTKLKCIKNRLSDPGPDGRRKPAPIADSEFTIDCDYVIPAISQSPDTSFIDPGMGISLNGNRISINKQGLMTSSEGIFASGDCVTGPQNLITAIGEGHDTAKAIDQHLMKKSRVKEVVSKKTFGQRGMRSIYQWRQSNQEIYDVIPMTEIDALKKEERGSFEREVDLGYKKEEGGLQADRCYLCNHNIHINEKDCILCANCVDVCPYDCIKIATQDKVIVKDPKTGGTKKEKEGLFYMLMDEEKCIRCGLCLDVCPTFCLTMDKITFSQTFEA
ncbi:MAG: FAD-dependent oxidoreductase [Nitrospinota bacterium]